MADHITLFMTRRSFIIMLFRGLKCRRVEVIQSYSAFLQHSSCYTEPSSLFRLDQTSICVLPPSSLRTPAPKYLHSSVFLPSQAFIMCIHAAILFVANQCCGRLLEPSQLTKGKSKECIIMFTSSNISQLSSSFQERHRKLCTPHPLSQLLPVTSKLRRFKGDR